MRRTYTLTSTYKRVYFLIFYIISTLRPYIIANTLIYRRPFPVTTYNTYTTSYYIPPRIACYSRFASFAYHDIGILACILRNTALDTP